MQKAEEDHFNKQTNYFLQTNRTVYNTALSTRNNTQHRDWDFVIAKLF